MGGRGTWEACCGLCNCGICPSRAVTHWHPGQPLTPTNRISRAAGSAPRRVLRAESPSKQPVGGAQWPGAASDWPAGLGSGIHTRLPDAGGLQHSRPCARPSCYHSLAPDSPPKCPPKFKHGTSNLEARVGPGQNTRMPMSQPLPTPMPISNRLGRHFNRIQPGRQRSLPSACCLVSFLGPILRNPPTMRCH